MRGTAAVVLALCVVLAGCSGVSVPGGDPTPTDGSTPTATATPTPTPTPSPSERLAEMDLPPGLSEDGIESPSALVEAHRENLAETGAVSQLSVAVEGNSVGMEKNVTARIGNDGTYDVAERGETSFGEFALLRFADGDELFLNESLFGETTYSSFTSAYHRSRGLPSATLRPVIAAVEFTVASIEESGDATLVTFSPAGANETMFDGENTTLDDVSGSLVVDLEGTVHALSVHYEVTTDAGTEVRDVEYAVEERGVDSVDEPAWVETARERTIDADLEYSIEDGVLVIEHVGGDVIPEGTQAIVAGTTTYATDVQNVTAFSATFTEDFEPGETGYVARADEDHGWGNVVIGDRPDGDVAPFPDELEVQLLDAHSSETIDAAIVRADDGDDA